jgi:hypothetical protein
VKETEFLTKSEIRSHLFSNVLLDKKEQTMLDLTSEAILKFMTLVLKTLSVILRLILKYQLAIIHSGITNLFIDEEQIEHYRQDEYINRYGDPYYNRGMYDSEEEEYER